MRRYESVVILDPDMLDDDIHSFTERFSTLIKSKGGEVIKIEDWGSKKLAYLVNKKDKGRYILFDFVGLPELINEMERLFKISEEVMKFLSVKLEEDVDLEAFKASAQEKTSAATPAKGVEAPSAMPGEAEPAEQPVSEATTEAVAASEETAPAPAPEEPESAQSSAQAPAAESKKEEE